MNNMLESLQKFMGKVVEDAKRTRDEAAETKELTKQVAAVLQEKEEQLRQLEEGYQKSLLGPLTKEFLNLRDELLSISEQTEGEISNHLDAIDKKFVKALAETGIHEIAINGRPDDLPPGFWETVGAATPTENSEKHGTVERIYTRGYTVCRPDGEKAVLRKAVVVLYAHSPDSSEPLSTSHS
jgi:molecular chaperone GrpE (heat shock protein)